MARASHGLIPAIFQNGHRARGPASFAIFKRHWADGFCKPRSQRDTVIDEYASRLPNPAWLSLSFLRNARTCAAHRGSGVATYRRPFPMPPRYQRHNPLRNGTSGPDQLALYPHGARNRRLVCQHNAPREVITFVLFDQGAANTGSAGGQAAD